MTLRFDQTVRARFRKQLMRRGQNLAVILSEVLAGKKPPSLASLLAAKPGKRPEEVLREALAQNETRRVMLDSDDDAFGRCAVCGVDLGEAALDEMPWADRCAEHRVGSA